MWEKFNREKAANGAVMRTSVVGVFKYWSLEEVISNCIKFCTVTHADPRFQKFITRLINFNSSWLRINFWIEQ